MKSKKKDNDITKLNEKQLINILDIALGGFAALEENFVTALDKYTATIKKYKKDHDTDLRIGREDRLRKVKKNVKDYTDTIYENIMKFGLTKGLKKSCNNSDNYEKQIKKNISDKQKQCELDLEHWRKTTNGEYFINSKKSFDKEIKKIREAYIKVFKSIKRIYNQYKKKKTTDNHFKRNTSNIPNKFRDEYQGKNVTTYMDNFIPSVDKYLKETDFKPFILYPQSKIKDISLWDPDFKYINRNKYVDSNDKESFGEYDNFYDDVLSDSDYEYVGGKRRRKKSTRKKYKKKHKKTRRKANKKRRKKGGKKYTSKRKPNTFRKTLRQHVALQDRLARRRRIANNSREQLIREFRSIIDAGQFSNLLTFYNSMLSRAIDNPQQVTIQNYQDWVIVHDMIKLAIVDRTISAQDISRINLMETLINTFRHGLQSRITQQQQINNNNFDTEFLGEESSSDEEATIERPT